MTTAIHRLRGVPPDAILPGVKDKVALRETVMAPPVSPRNRLGAWLELAGLTGILGIGAYLRFVDLDYAQFRPDDAALLNIARRLVEHPEILSSGIPSSAAGFANGPFQAYLLLPAVLLFSGPLAAYYLVAALNLAGIALFWGFARSYWGQRVALVAALLFAVNPWAVIFSRRLWGNDLTAPFVVLLIWSLCDLATKGRRRDSVMPFVWLAVLIQLYVGALIHLAAFGIGLILGRGKARVPFVLAGVAIFLLLTGPYLFGVLLKNLDSIALPVGSLSGNATVDHTSLLFMLHAVSSEGYQAFANNAGNIVDASAGLPKIVSIASEGLLVIGLAVAAVETTRGLRRRASVAPYALTAAAVLLPALLLVRHGATVYVYYLLVGLPMHFLLVTLGLRRVWRSAYIAAIRCTRTEAGAGARASGRKATLAVGLAPVAIVAMHLTLAQAFFQAIHEFWPKGDYGVPLRYTSTVADRIKQLAREQDASRVLVGGAASQEGVLLAELGRDIANLTFSDSERAFIVPSTSGGKVVYVVPTTDDPIGQEMARQLADRQVGSIDLPGYGWSYGFFVLEQNDLVRAAALQAATPATPHAARLGDYLQLLGYQLPSESVLDVPLRLATYWKVLRRPTENISLFTHLIGNRGSLWAQQDGLSYPIDQWQPGDVLVDKHTLSIPPGAPPADYAVEAGAYYVASGQRLPVITAIQQDDRLRLGSTRLNRSSAPVAPPDADLNIRFGDAIALRGFRLDGSPAAGQQIRLRLYWQSLGATSHDYTVFVHLAGADGKPVAQSDGPPAFGMLPTSSWRRGDLLRDEHDIGIPADLVPGRYRLLVGLYLPPDGSRLSPNDADTSPIDRLARALGRRGLWPSGTDVHSDSVELSQMDIGGR